MKSYQADGSKLYEEINNVIVRIHGRIVTRMGRMNYIPIYLKAIL